MKKILLCFFMAMVTVVFYSCQKNNPNECRIHGVVNGEKYEGKRIFLIPFYGPKTAETVDSVEIKDGKFEFTTDTMRLYKILLDFQYRMGTQPLLVVGEPGDVKVVIDSVSHAVGTPQNDSLEQWKLRTEIHNLQMRRMRTAISELEEQGSKGEADKLSRQADSIHLAYKNYTRRMAKNMEGQTLGDFMKDMFPLTYKKKFPDGRVATMNADTNEEIVEVNEEK